MAYIEHEKTLRDGTLVGGEPTPAQRQTLIDAGYKTMVSLRGHGESAFTKDDYEKSGAKLVHLPISGPHDFSEAFLEKFNEVISTTDTPRVIFCATGNRVGAALALHAFRFKGHDVNSALELGKNAGLTRLEPFVRSWLDAQS